MKEAIQKHLENLLMKSLNFFGPLQELVTIREKLEGRGSLHDFDKEGILNELGTLQSKIISLNSEMLALYDLLKTIK